ncbi:MAG: hypothetical protein MJ124_07000 [Lachnospiraceae bacterium]|nr:hypothetical protein [Lachnospiraceae bacterium]
MDNQPFEKSKVQNGKFVFFNVVDASIEYNDFEMPIVFDIVINDSISKAKINVTFGTIDEGIGILLFGDSFPEYCEYVALLLDKQYAEQCCENINNASIETSSTTNNPKYIFCNQNHNSSISGGNASNETVIITVSKRDFKDDVALGSSGAKGFEVIRIFGRSNNVKNAISGATSVFPYKATAKFTCNTTNFLQIFDTTPSNSSSSLPPAFDLISSVIPGADTAIATVNLLLSLLSSTSVTKSMTGSNTHYNSVEVAMTIASANASQADLPATSPRATARNNTSNGVACEITYTSLASSVLTGSVTASGKMLYKVYTNNGHQMLTATTGYASITHNVYYVGA